MYLEKCRGNLDVGEDEKRVWKQQGLCQGSTLCLKLPTSPLSSFNLKVTFSDRSLNISPFSSPFPQPLVYPQFTALRTICDCFTYYFYPYLPN